MSTKCTSCEAKIKDELIHEDDDCNPFCSDCWQELAPVMKSDYKKEKKSKRMEENKYHFAREIIVQLRSTHAINEKVYLHWIDNLLKEEAAAFRQSSVGGECPKEKSKRMEENKYHFAREIIVQLRSTHAINEKVYLHWIDNLLKEEAAAFRQSSVGGECPKEITHEKMDYSE